MGEHRAKSDEEVAGVLVPSEDEVRTAPFARPRPSSPPEEAPMEAARRPRTFGGLLYGDRARLPDPPARPPLGRLALAAKVAAIVALGLAVYWGPPYHTCRQMKERGMFYYGTTISGCARERIAERADPFHGLVSAFFPRFARGTTPAQASAAVPSRAASN